MTQQDYYRVLGVEPAATAKQIKDAYREQAFKHHPDRSNDPNSAERMKAVNEAYAVLSHPEKRSEYDALRRRFGDSAHRQFRQTYSQQDIFQGSDVHQIFEEMARSFGLRGFDEIFKEIHTKGYTTFSTRRPGFFAGGFVFGGGSRPGSDGSPAKPPPRMIHQVLGRLLGRALQGAIPQAGQDICDTITLAPELAHSGGAYAYFLKQHDKKLVVKVPAGVREGQQIRLAGMGMPGLGGAPNGDLRLKVKLHRSLTDRIKGMLGGRRRQA